MSYVAAAPRPRSTNDAHRRAAAADIDRLSRRRRPPIVELPNVQVAPEPVEMWPVGTAWMDTLTVGPLGSHPLKVKLADGTWDRVAWLVPLGT